MEYLLLKETNFSKLKSKIKKNPGKKIAFTSENDDLNRKVLEKLPIDIFLINQKSRKDFQKQRESGLNHVLAKIAKEKGIQIGINLDEIIESHGKEKAKILARVLQNIKICKKHGVQMQFVSSKKQNLPSLKSLGLSLGMPTWMIGKLKNSVI